MLTGGSLEQAQNSYQRGRRHLLIQARSNGAIVDTNLSRRGTLSS